MLIRVSEIPEDGIHIEGVGSVERPFSDPAWRLEDLSLDVQRDGEVVLVRGRLGARVPQTCGRCVEGFEVSVAAEVDARFVPSPAAPGEERELGAADLETDVYAHDVVDVAALIETETTLRLPMKPLCREDCRGLCPQCGANRNVAPCACQERQADPRWAPLKALADRLSSR
jgi:uncharacterized protein